MGEKIMVVKWADEKSKHLSLSVTLSTSSVVMYWQYWVCDIVAFAEWSSCQNKMREQRRNKVIMKISFSWVFRGWWEKIVIEVVKYWAFDWKKELRKELKCDVNISVVMSQVLCKCMKHLSRVTYKCNSSVINSFQR